MISPRVNYQPLWPELVLPKKRHFYVAPRYTRHSLWVFSLFFSPPHFFFFLPSPFFARRPNGRTFEATRPLASGLAWPPTEYRSSGNRPKLMPGFNIPANMDIFGFAAKRQAQPSLSSLLSDLVATRNTILRISSSILILIAPWVFRALGGAPLVSCTSRCFRFIDQNLGRCWSKVRLEGPRIGCATFFSHVIGLESKRLNLFEERLCLCFIMRLMNGWWLFERMIN